MKTKYEIYEFIKDNEGEKLDEYYLILKEKLDNLYKKINRTTLFFILITLAYFLSLKASVTSIQFGPLTFSDFSVIYKLSPILFSYFLLEYALMHEHRTQTQKVLTWIALKRYKQKLTLYEFENNYFVGLILPFSFWIETIRIYQLKRPKWVDLILILPVGVIIIFFPFVFEYILIRRDIIEYWNDIFGKISVIVSAWIFLFVIVYYSRTFLNNYTILKKEKDLDNRKI